MKKYLIILPAIALSIANLSAGDGSKKKSPETIFAKADANSDGKVTLEEFTAVAKKPEKAATRFAKLDLNSDGTLTLVEITEAIKEKADKKTESN